MDEEEQMLKIVMEASIKDEEARVEKVKEMDKEEEKVIEQIQEISKIELAAQVLA